MMKFVLLLFANLLINTLVNGQNAVQKLDQANKFYQSKKYDKAIKEYEEVLEKGYESTALYYNLGNAYFRQNQLGRSILNYEKALVLTPNDQQIKHNLKVANNKQIDQIETIPPFFLAQWWKGLRQILSSSSWAIVTLLLVWLAIGGFALWLMSSERDRKKKGFLFGVIALVLSFLPLFLALSQSQFESDTQTAIVLQSEIALRSAPDAESQSIVTIHEGVKIELLDQISDWYKVQLGDGEQGWLPEKCFEKI